MFHEKVAPLVSIIIPCYNHGKYIDETIESINRISDKSLFEVIIVDDGSNDDFTKFRLNEISNAGIHRVVIQKNQGVCVARNNGINLAKGKYILPVDSDNRLLPQYLMEAIKVFEENPKVDIVYTDYYLFGAETGLQVAGEFNLQRLMLGNYIDNCSMYRKSLISEIGGYDTFPNLVGNEDWELWLRAAFLGHKFHYINKPLFEYRVVENSQVRRLLSKKGKGDRNIEYFQEKFPTQYGFQYVNDYFFDKFKRNPVGQILKLLLMIYLPSFFKSLVNKGKLRKYI